MVPLHFIAGGLYNRDSNQVMSGGLYNRDSNQVMSEGTGSTCLHSWTSWITWRPVDAQRTLHVLDKSNEVRRQ